MALSHQKFLWGSLLLGTLIISLIAWIVFVPRFKSLVLYFPGADNLSLESEIHYIPWSKSESDQIRHAVHSLTNGPLSMKYRRIMPASAGVKAVYLKEKQLWIDFDPSIQAPDSECPLSPKKRISLIINSLQFNFPYLQHIKILVDGQELGAIPYQVKRKS